MFLEDRNGIIAILLPVRRPQHEHLEPGLCCLMHGAEAPNTAVPASHENRRTTARGRMKCVEDSGNRRVLTDQKNNHQFSYIVSH
jgi:hypothetical protein